MDIDESVLCKGAVVLTGLNSAILGHTGDGLLVYGHQGLLTCFKTSGMSEEEAQEWIEYNVLPLQGQGKGFVFCYDIP